MRMMAKRVKNQDVEAFELSKGFVGNGAKIREIRSRAEAIGFNRIVTMIYRKRHEHRAKQVDRAGDVPQFDLGKSSVFIVAVEDVLENMPNDLGGRLGCIERNLSAARRARKAEWANVVEAENMVGMTMGIKHGVNTADAPADGLLTKIGRSVDQDGAAVVLHHNRRPQSFVVRIARMADRTGAPDGGNAHPGAAAQYRESGLH